MSTGIAVDAGCIKSYRDDTAKCNFGKRALSLSLNLHKRYAYA